MALCLAIKCYGVSVFVISKNACIISAVFKNNFDSMLDE